MKILLATLIAVPTSFSTTNISETRELQAALESAVDDVVSHAIGFSPTFVTVQNARVVGDRMFILLLIGDDEGAQMLQMFSADGEAADKETADAD